MDLKGYFIGGCLVVAENQNEAKELYLETSTWTPTKTIVEKDLDETFYYFNLSEIHEEDIIHIYDRKYPDGKEVQVSLKRPIARKYREVTGNRKEVIFLYC